MHGGGAEKVYGYMVKHGEALPVYDFPIYPPIGHDAFHDTVWKYFYKDSAAMLCLRVQAAISLYKVKQDNFFKLSAKDALLKLGELVVIDKDGAYDYCRTDAGNDTPYEVARFFFANIPLAFAEALSIWSDDKCADFWLNIVEGAVKKYEKQARENPYGVTTNFCTVDASGERTWEHFASSNNLDLAETVLFLTMAARFAGKERCLGIAQGLLDWLLGYNPLDASSIEGIGYNHSPRAEFGEFFPPTPQIPGAVITELCPELFSNELIYGREYDMPITGRALYAFAKYADSIKNLL